MKQRSFFVNFFFFIIYCWLWWWGGENCGVRSGVGCAFGTIFIFFVLIDDFFFFFFDSFSLFLSFSSSFLPSSFSFFLFFFAGLSFHLFPLFSFFSLSLSSPLIAQSKTIKTQQSRTKKVLHPQDTIPPKKITKSKLSPQKTLTFFHFRCLIF